MNVQTPDGREIRVRRRLIPWRLRRRRIDLSNADPFAVLDGADGIEGLLFGLVLGVIFLLFGGVILVVALFASEAILLFLLLLPLLGIARLLWIVPWTIEAREGATTLGLARARGWRASEERIQELADDYRLGRDPFAVAEH